MRKESNTQPHLAIVCDQCGACLALPEVPAVDGDTDVAMARRIAELAPHRLTEVVAFFDAHAAHDGVFPVALEPIEQYLARS